MSLTSPAIDDQTAEGGTALRVGQYIGRSWELFWRYPLVFFLGILVLQMISGLTNGILYGPVMCGIMYATLKAVRGSTPEFGDLFKGFDKFGQSLLAGLIVLLITVCSFALCLPGIFLTPFFVLVFAFIIDGDLPWDKAISASWNAAKNNYGKFLGFTILAGLFSLLGFLACCIGVWVTAPIASMAAAVLYADVTGTLDGAKAAPPAENPPPALGEA